MRYKYFTLLLVLAASSFASAQSAKNDSEYTLYRAGIDVLGKTQDETLRVHIATFDAQVHSDPVDNAKYNFANCDYAQAFFNDNQPHFRGSIYSNLKIRYWCEKGRYKK